MGQTVDVIQEVIINSTFVQELTKNGPVPSVCAVYVLAHSD